MLESKLLALQRILRLDAKQVQKVVLRMPTLLSCRTEAVIQKVELLAEISGRDLATDRAQMGKYILQTPNVLSYSKENLQAKVQWFRSAVGVDNNVNNDKWTQKNLLQSGILTMSVESMERKRLWLQNRLELNQDQIARVIRYQARLVCRSIDDSIEPSLQWIEQRFGLKDNKPAIGNMICKLPSILSYSIEANLEPKLAFFIKTFFPGDEPTALATFIHDPILLSYSLEKRLLPRWQQWQELELSSPDDLPRLRNICKYTNDQWESSLERKRKIII